MNQQQLVELLHEMQSGCIDADYVRRQLAIASDALDRAGDRLGRLTTLTQAVADAVEALLLPATQPEAVEIRLDQMTPCPPPVTGAAADPTP